jgi:tetratricopeptide (TPR) repeat protein
MANAKSELKGQLGFTTSGYISAASYSYQNNIDRAQGIRRIDKALEAEPTNYRAVWIKARFLIRDGKAGKAEMLIKSALEKSSETELERFGNMLLNPDITDRAIKVFLLYSERYPKSAISWYYLREGYFNKRKKNDAIVVFRKSLSLNPTIDNK